MTEKITIGNSFIIISDCDENEAEISKVFVSKDERGNGVAKKLISMAEQKVRALGYSVLSLYAEPDCEEGLQVDALISLYESCGFSSDGDCSQLMSKKL